MFTQAGKSAEDAAFSSLTVGVHFPRNRFEHQRQLFEQQQQQQKKTSASPSGRAAPVVIASDGSIIGAASAGAGGKKKAQQHTDSDTIHAMVASLPPPRLDFISQTLLEPAAGKNSKKGGGGGDDDDDGDEGGDRKNKLDAEAAAAEEAHKKNPVKAPGRKAVGNFLDKNAVTVKGRNEAKPGAVPVTYILQHFSELLRPPYSAAQHVTDNLFARHLTRPTTIQALAVPMLAHDRRNVLGCAPTGSGKTLAFLLPMFTLLRRPDPSSAGPRALIVAPTKELAAQIEREAQFLMKGAAWRAVQYGHTTKGKDIFVTTPARAVSMAASGSVVLDTVEYLVFDEGDKLWEGASDFSIQVRQIVNYVHGVKQQAPDAILAQQQSHDQKSKKSATVAGNNKNNRNDGDDDDADQQQQDENEDEAPFQYRAGVVTAFFSATLPKKAEKIACSFMQDPVSVVIRGRTSANVDCEQRLVFTGNEIGKVTEIRNMVQQGDMRPPVLVFVQSIERAKELYDEIRAAKLRVALLHADLSAEDRDAVVLKFRMGEIWVLITTELLARGVDFKGVETVINFDIPLTPESYIHRVGRTGRAGRRGTAVTFFTEADKLRIGPIAKIVHESGSKVEPYLLEMKQPTRHELRKLEHSVPGRLAVSTRKRSRIGEQRIMRQANKYCKKDDDVDDEYEEQQQQQQQRKKATAASRKKIPNQSEEFDDDDFY